MALRPLMRKPFSLFLLIICATLIVMIHTTTNYNNFYINQKSSVYIMDTKPPIWYQKICGGLHKRKFGFINADNEKAQVDGLVDVVTVEFEAVGKEKKWEDLFPEWVDEEGKWGPMKCPEIAMPPEMEEVEVVVARVPEGGRDVYRLQVNLVVARVLVNGGGVYAVFIGAAAAMPEIFRCDDMIWEEGEYRIFKPEMRRLKQKVDMPVGSCLISHPFPQPKDKKQTREAYVTILHSSEAYVCGAIALGQSIMQTNTTKDLILLADDSISLKSLKGLEAAGWKIKHIQRIRNPHAKFQAYNEYNYSKLRIWQLTEYDKVIFIDADLILLKNMDDFFSYPQLSAVGNDKFLFNSGVMLVEPSKCMFSSLMEKIYTLSSYNGGDQGFLNEAFTWWHRLPSKLNHLKVFQTDNNEHEIKENTYTIHYLGWKPWMCYKDYDCNWDMLARQRFASDSAHKIWWNVYDAMPLKLRSFCELTEKMDIRLQRWRRLAKNASFSDGHWKIIVKDRRRHWLS